MQSKTWRFSRFILLLPVFCLGILICASIQIEAGPPFESFPSFIPTGAPTEGVAVDKTGNVFISVRAQEGAQIWKITPNGEMSFFANFGRGDASGLAVDAPGNVYAALSRYMVKDPPPDNGVYRVDRNGQAERLPDTEQIVAANALAFDQRGNLYVTESYSFNGQSPTGQGGIWRISKKGVTELWLRDDLLTGIGFLGFPVGANGIAFYHGDLYVANTDKGMVVRIAILPDGSPGIPEVWKKLDPVYNPDWRYPIMPDGLSMDVHGNVYLAVVSRYAVMRINANDRSQETVAAVAPPAPFALLDTPASLAFGTGKGGRTNLFVTNLGWSANHFYGLVKIETGEPGLPLP